MDCTRAEGAVASALVELASACMRTRAESRPAVRAARQEVERAFLAASAIGFGCALIRCDISSDITTEAVGSKVTL